MAREYPPPTLRIQRLPPNINGRDFVCGDVHGAYSCVTRFLEASKFDKEKDRLICAGDLVDRGPTNEACLALLTKPWFFMAKGNHEELMEAWFAGHPLGYWWGRNGGNWGTKYKDEQSPMAEFVRTAVKFINELPYLITVELPDGSLFHVMHAELPPNWDEPITDETLADPAQFTELAVRQTNDGNTITWGRHIFYPMYRSEPTELLLKKAAKRAYLEKMGNYFGDKLSHIYSGHTIMKKAVTFRGQTNLDTCAYGSYTWMQHGSPQYPPEWCGLTVAEPRTGKFWLVNDREFKEIQPAVVPVYEPPKRGTVSEAMYGIDPAD